MTTIDVQPSIYYTAAAALHTAAAEMFQEVEAKQVGALAGCASMAGSYEEAKTWAAEYDSRAAMALFTATALVSTMDDYSKVLREIGYHHATSDYNATTGDNKGTAPTKPADPGPARSVCAAPVPSAGGPGNGLHDIVHLAEKVGITIPDGDTDKLGTVGDGWAALQNVKAVAGLSDKIGRIINAVSLVTSPEAATVIADLKGLQSSAQTIAAGFGNLATLCHDHKTALDDLRTELKKQLLELSEELVKEAAIGLAISIAASVVTFGVGAVIEAARVARIVEKFAGPIKDLVKLWKATRLEKGVKAENTLEDEAKRLRKLQQRIEKTPEKPSVPEAGNPAAAAPRVDPAGWTPGDATSISDYTSNGYKDLNTGLREGDLSPAQQARADSLNSALSKLPNHQGIVVRGTKLPKEVLDTYQERATVTEKGFTSSSATADGAFTGGGNDVEMHILSKTGKDVSNYSMAGRHEEEVLFGSGTKFNVVRRFEQNGKTIIFMEEK